MRKIQFHPTSEYKQNECYYHIYNRGVDKREVFCDEKDYLRFLINLRNFNNNSTKEQREYAMKTAQDLESNSGYPELDSFLATLPKFVEIIAYCLNPNHYHLLLMQRQESGISKFMHKLGTAYTNYFNKKDNRSGSLFQGNYKTVSIKTDEQLLYVSAYINANAEIHNIAKAKNYKWCSYMDYLGKRQGSLCNKKVILDQFGENDAYEDYVGLVVANSKDVKKELRNMGKLLEG